ncbi:methyltransferase type 12 [Rhodoferax koreense]|uniref:Methyltransferase type 12 n=1 Tax=Rhodoferax koreensis TaxID=1842727 RepID=A0A1P8JRY5_9BURK|nr:class I SAM-dependent methyltransferase [Rhodoferax koreense]APW36491.1 methyltransferase type 12 [Rhodoferax koreense]
MPDNYLPQVREQYEALPYPPRDPQDDRKRLVQTWLEDLPMINHYGYAGRQSFRHGFKALVAGGGTGDATIFLAEQLRAIGADDARVVHLDMSAASIAIAKERAAIRGLANIEWVHDSLLNLPALAPALGRFDYINCSGVLHHLADPDEGFKALLSVLKDDGVIGLMVYASIGRTGVYQMQQLMRLVNGDTAATPRKIANTKDILASLPPGNWFARGGELHHDHKMGDAGIYDLLLHSQDRAYSVGELFDWLGEGPGGHGFHLAFSDVQRGRSPYLPHMVLGARPPAVLAELRQRPLRQQYEMAELLGGNIITHSLYLTRSAACTAVYGDAEMVPFYFHEPLTGPVVEKVFGASRGQPFRLNHQHSGVSMMVNPGRYGAKLLGLIDGQRSFGEIFDLFRAGWHGQAAAPDNAALFADLAESYETLNALDRMLLRHPAATSAS